MPHNLRLGISLIVAATFVISSQDVLYKLGAAHLSLWQVFALRGLLVLPALVLLMRLTQGHTFQLGSLGQALQFWPLWRGLTFAASLLVFYAALPNLPLSTLGAAHYTAPLIIAALSPFLAGEGLTRLGLAGLGLGFVGLLLIVQPGGDSFTPWIFLPLMGALLYAASHLITRAKCSRTPASILAFSQNVFMMLGGLGVSLILLLASPSPALLAADPQIFGSWQALNGTTSGILVLMACQTLVASFLIARAYQSAPAPVVGAFEYSYLLFALMWDVILGQLPNTLALLGAGLILIAGLMVAIASSERSRPK